MGWGRSSLKNREGELRKIVFGEKKRVRGEGVASEEVGGERKKKAAGGGGEDKREFFTCNSTDLDGHSSGVW